MRLDCHSRRNQSENEKKKKPKSITFHFVKYSSASEIITVNASSGFRILQVCSANGHAAAWIDAVVNKSGVILLRISHGIKETHKSVDHGE